MKDPLIRFKPYLRSKEVILFERLREVTGVSIGNILMTLLVESETFVKLSENKDGTNEDLKNIFRGLCSIDDFSHNKQKKEKKCNTKK